MSRRPADFTVPTLSGQEKEHLKSLYMDMGAWTQTEGIAALGAERFNQFVREGLLGRQQTLMGPVFHLLALGRIAVFGTANDAASLTSQLDQCYFRLCLQKLNWHLIQPGEPLSRDLQQYAPSSNYREVRTSYGVALVAGKLNGAGITTDHLRKLALQQRSSALHHRYYIVILTPSPKRARTVEAQFQAFLKIERCLPRTTNNDSISRFITIPKSQAKDHGAVLTPTGAERNRKSKTPLPEYTLETLMLPRKARIERAELALDCDGVLTSQQLIKHFGLTTQDLSGRLATSTILRPKGKSTATEVQTNVIIANKKLIHVPENTLAHRIGLSETRQTLSIEPDPERWVIEPGTREGYEKPDARFIDENGEQHAVEYDAGWYSYPTIEKKLDSFQSLGYTNVIYAVATPLRGKNVYERFAAKLPNPPILAKWW